MKKPKNSLDEQAWRRAMDNSKPRVATPYEWEEYEKEAGKNMARISFEENAETIEHRLTSFLQEAKFGNAQVHLNSDALVIEYNDLVTGVKRWELLAHIAKNNS